MQTPTATTALAIGGTVVVTLLTFVLAWRFGGKAFTDTVIRASKALQVEDLRPYFASKSDVEDVRKEAKDGVEDLAQALNGYMRYADERHQRLEREVLPVLRDQTQVLRELAAQASAHTEAHRRQDETMKEVKRELRLLRGRRPEPDLPE